MGTRHGLPRIDLSIVVPAYNEAERLPDLLRGLAARVDPETTELVVVDDGSNDGTAEVAARACQTLPLSRCMRLPRNRGKGAAVRAGMLSARGRIVAYMDADMATDLRSLDPLTAALRDADVAIGSRAHDGSVVEHARLDRTILGRTFNRFTRAVTGFDHLDTQCGFKAFHRPVAKLLFAMSRIDGFAFDVEILHLAHRLDLRVVEVPVHWQHVDGSKISPLSDSFRMAADTIRLAVRKPTLKIAGLRFDRGSGGTVASAVHQLDERLLISWADDSIEVLFAPQDRTDVSVMAQHFESRGVWPLHVERDCGEFLGRHRLRRISLGLPTTDPPSITRATVDHQ